MLPSGFQTSALRCGVKKRAGDDLGLLLADAAAPAAALFTRNELLGAHITVCRENLTRSGGSVRAVLVNSGNANCATGVAGVEDARELCATLAAAIGCPPEQVLMISTGVIGARLPVARIAAALPELLAQCSADGFERFARAIMTTDTRQKIVERTGDGWSLVGCAKGAGMIHPDMATMLAFALTDAGLPSDPLTLLRASADRSFQRLTIDGDTSPNDTVLLWGSGRTEVDGEELEGVVTGAYQELCRAIAADGEGATRLITVRVTSASSEAEATHVGRLIATSPLVKTAVTGRDPNWGRILAAAGRAGLPLDLERVVVSIGDAVLYADGRPHPECEPQAHRHLADETEVTLGIDLARGRASAEVWTCDLTREYVTINAEYRT